MGNTNIERVSTAQRRAFVLRLRRGGLTYRQIAAAAVKEFGEDRLPGGWGPRYAHKDIRRELEHLREEVDEEAAAVRELELGRLDRMLTGLWPKATTGKAQAVHALLAVMRRRAKLLGLDWEAGQHREGKGPAHVIADALRDVAESYAHTSHYDMPHVLVRIDRLTGRAYLLFPARPEPPHPQWEIVREVGEENWPADCSSLQDAIDRIDCLQSGQEP